MENIKKGGGEKPDESLFLLHKTISSLQLYTWKGWFFFFFLQESQYAVAKKVSVQ